MRIVGACAAMYLGVVATVVIAGCADARGEASESPNQVVASVQCGSPAAGSGGTSGSELPRVGISGESAKGPAQCVAAGGTCMLGSGVPFCAEPGQYDCNPERNPGGAFCCLRRKVEMALVAPPPPIEGGGACGAASTDDADGGTK
jgi:hypothetical protein